MPFPLMSNRQRADESFRRTQENLHGALAAIKAAKDEADQKRRLGLQDQLTQQTVDANAMSLDKSRQEQGLVAQMSDIDSRAPGAAGPMLPGEFQEGQGALTQKTAGDRFKYQTIAKLRTMRGKEATPEMVQAEYETAAAQATAAQSEATAAPKLRELEMGYKTASTESVKAGTEKTKKETELLGKPKPVDPADTMEVAKFARQLKQDFYGNPVTRDYQVIETTIKKLDNSLTEFRAREKTAKAKGGKVDKGAIDQTLITLFNKLLDPTSVVRESEYARTPEGMAYLDGVTAKLEKFKQGGAGITDEFRDEIIESARVLQKAAEQGFSSFVQSNIADAQSYGIDPERVVGGYSRLLNQGAGGAGGKLTKIGRFQVEAD